jgi:hypothetical protein
VDPVELAVEETVEELCEVFATVLDVVGSTKMICVDIVLLDVVELEEVEEIIELEEVVVLEAVAVLLEVVELEEGTKVVNVVELPDVGSTDVSEELICVDIVLDARVDDDDVVLV